MYGLKRIEFNENGSIKAFEFHPDISGKDIAEILLAFNMLSRSAAEYVAPRYGINIDNAVPETQTNHSA